ncbi:DUF1837 domain-containing protein [Turicibacter sanguinis]|uniref:HamA C-terminal domain-containing protein n=1 Tax=Turicibacter sanguinis TaxID=154288 RepID=UPI0039930E2C
MITEDELKEMLLKNDSLFNQVYIFQEDFDIIPKNNHIGSAIKFKDIKECRQGFIDELVNTVVDWIYSSSKSEKILADLMKEGRTLPNAFSEINRNAFNKFRGSGNGELLQGQFGELLLFCFIQRFFEAVPLLRKMSITTSAKHERFGADAIHYKLQDGKNILYLGESKVYKSSYKFNSAFEDAINSILKTYQELDNELDLYIYEDFLDDKLLEIAKRYKNSQLDNVEVHLVNFVMYNETSSIDGDSEADIKNNIYNVIQRRYSNYSNEKIDVNKYRILKRVTYIVMPIWKLDELLDMFGEKIRR